MATLLRVRKNMSKCINCFDAEQSGRHGGMCSGKCRHEYRAGESDDSNNKKGGSLKLDYTNGQGAAR